MIASDMDYYKWTIYQTQGLVRTVRHAYSLVPIPYSLHPALKKMGGKVALAAALSLGCLEGAAIVRKPYCKSLVTSCCTLLACANAAMPVCERISYFDIFDVAEA
jgi:hypothetical protein